MPFSLPEAIYPKPTDRISFYDRLNERAGSAPGIEAAAIASHAPTEGYWTYQYAREFDPSNQQKGPEIALLVIGPDYFRVMDIEVIRGRTFTGADGGEGRPPVAIVNRMLADRLWPGEDLLGKRLRLLDAEQAKDWLTVVGVVPEILQDGVTEKGYV